MKCTRCKLDKHIDAFNRQGDRRRQPCRKCENEGRREQRATEREVLDQKGRYYDDGTPELLRLMNPTR